MNNPYVALRVLIMIDVAMWGICIIIPDFWNDSLIAYILSIRTMDQVDACLASLWLLSTCALITSWIGMLMCRNWGRLLYPVPLLLTMIISFVRGNGHFGPGMQAVLLDIMNCYFGFVLCVVYFTKVAVIFRRNSKREQ